MDSTLVFFVSAACVAIAGARVAGYGDDIAEGTGLGELWVGAFLVAAATSLPELATDLNAVLLDRPGLAVGDLFGSSMANMAILAIADLATRRTRMLTRVTVNQAMVASLATCLTLVATIGILSTWDLSIAGVGFSSIVIGLAYVAGMRLLHSNRDAPPFRSEAELAARKRERRDLSKAFVGFGVSALVILVTAPFLASSAAGLSDRMGIGDAFAGMVLLAVVTSLAEASVSFHSVRAGAYGLAVGNLLGSNCFNMAALLPLDIVYRNGPLLGAVDGRLAIGGLFAILLMALATLDVLNRSERRWWIVEPGPALMLAVYLIGLCSVYTSALP
jgi:cation:H+ antiporter